MAGNTFCTCPITEINDITATTCADVIGIIKKMVFCRIQDSQAFVAPNTEATVTTIATLAEWADTLAASDDTKSVITDYLANVTIAQSDINTQELNQTNVASGNAPPQVTAMSVNASAATIASMRNLQCEKGNIFVYFLTEDNRIVHANDGTIPQGFKVMNGTIAFGTKGVDGSSSDAEINMLQFDLDPNWDADFTRTEGIDLNFLTDLTN